jgi:AmiR/NasT family two-component response regulator
MRLRDTTIGALNLFRSEVGELNEHDLRAAQALADVATIGILHERSFRANDVLRDQLQGALTSRVAVEQAKGVLAHRHGVDMDEAFRMLRDYARSNRLPLAAAARGVVERRIRL